MAEKKTHQANSTGGAVLITGGRGLLGQAVVRSLRAAGRQVIATTRLQAPVPGATQTLTWAPERQPFQTSALSACNAVINLGGSPIDGRRWTQAEKSQILHSRLTVTQAIVEAMVNSAARVLLSASAAGYYGDRGDEILTETSSAGRGFRAEACIRWEAAANVARGHGIRVVTLRTGSVLAPRGPLMDRLMLFTAVGGRSLGSGRQWFPWVHIDDVAQLVLLALDTTDMVGPLNLAAPAICRQEELLETLCRLRGRPSVVRVPALLLRARYGEAASFILSSQRVAPAEAVSRGYRFQHPELHAALGDVMGQRHA